MASKVSISNRFTGTGCIGGREINEPTGKNMGAKLNSSLRTVENLQPSPLRRGAAVGIADGLPQPKTQHLAEQSSVWHRSSRGHETLILPGLRPAAGKGSESPYVDSYEMGSDHAKRLGVRQSSGAMGAFEGRPLSKTWWSSHWSANGKVEVMRLRLRRATVGCGEEIGPLGKFRVERAGVLFHPDRLRIVGPRRREPAA